MANRTVKDARTIHGTNPQYLIEKIIRTRVYESKYWKEDCFALNMELLVDKGVEMRFVGGVYGGNIKPSPFICLILKMLQIQPEEDIVLEFITQSDFKYLRALGAFYYRLTGSSLNIWKVLEPLYTDYRQLRVMDRMGKFTVTTMDQYIDDLLREERVFDVILPRISKRQLHEENGDLKPKKWLLDSELNETGETDTSDSDSKQPEVKDKRTKVHSTSSSSAKSRNNRNDDRRERRRDDDRDRERRRHRSRSRSRSRDRRRRSRSQDRRDRRDRHESRSESKKNESLEIEEANKLRAKLGLKPLKVTKETKTEPIESQSTKKMSEEDEIEEANKLRAKLGLKPLRR